MSDQSPLSAHLDGPSPEEVAGHSFPSARRGLDPEAVRAYLVELAEALRRQRRRETELQRREAELQGRLANAEQASTPTVLDAAALSAAVGSETARVLQVAHEAAGGVIAQAQARAEEIMNQAESVFANETRRAEEAVDSITAEARSEADATIAAARGECREMVEAARAARHRILADLAARRRELHVQLEQLRAGKDALADVVDAVASYVVHSVDELKGQLAGAEEQARYAAEAAGGGVALLREPSEEELMAEAASILAGEAPTAGPPGAPAGPGPTPPRTMTPQITAASAGEVSGVTSVLSEGAVTVVAPVETEPTEPEEGEAPVAAGAAGSPIDELFAKIRQSRMEQVERARSVLADAELGEGALADPSLGTELPEAGDTSALPEAPAEEPAVSELEDSDAAEAGLNDPDPAFAEAAAEELPPAAAAEEAAPIGEAAVGEVVVGEVAESDAPESDAPDGGEAIQPDSSDAAATTGDSNAELVSEAAEDAPDAAEDREGVVADVAPVLAARDELLAPSAGELARVIKRQLRLEQNELLDAFRNLRKGIEAASLLPGEEMTARLASGAGEAVAAAFSAGHAFAARDLDPPPSTKRRPPAEIGAIARALGEAVVAPIRRRLEIGLLEEHEEATAAIGAAFREWKGIGADQAAADFSIRAFSAGVLDVAKTCGRPVSWIVDDGDSRCPDCDDNAIAGAQAAGSPFPTGHEHPPIHPGCRCLLVLSPA